MLPSLKVAVSEMCKIGAERGYPEFWGMGFSGMTAYGSPHGRDAFVCPRIYEEPMRLIDMFICWLFGRRRP